MRYACLCLHLGCCKKQSKTSKVYTQSFLSAREILAQLNHGFSLVLPEPMLSDSQIEQGIKLISQSRQTLEPGAATQCDRLFVEPNKPITKIQSHHLLESLFTTLNLKRGSTFELVFKLVMFFNSLPGVHGTSRQNPTVPMRQAERRDFCSPQLFRLLVIVKVADQKARSLFCSATVVKTIRSNLENHYEQIIANWFK